MVWKYEFNRYWEEDHIGSTYTILDEKGNLMCKIECEDHDEEGESRRIAELIVNAVNERISQKKEMAK